MHRMQLFLFVFVFRDSCISSNLLLSSSVSLLSDCSSYDSAARPIDSLSTSTEPERFLKNPSLLNVPPPLSYALSSAKTWPGASQNRAGLLG